jgi:putative DNA primase/helicase
LANLQFIQPDGAKRFLKGGRKQGCCWRIGPAQGAGTLCIAEGYATAASIHEATARPVLIAFDAGNLQAVAEAARKLHPEADIILCADHDLSGKGQRGAALAALAVGGKVAMPETPGQDFNDLARQGHGRA